MFYQLAASTGNKGANAKMGRALVNKLITRLKLQPNDYYIADGSGLSLYNYVSPELEVAFLRYAYANDNIYPHLITAMPIAGVDGTLEKRMRSGYAHGNVKAKTGTVTGVSALTGYCTAANGHLLCFSFYPRACCMVNQEQVEVVTINYIVACLVILRIIEGWSTAHSATTVADH